MSGVNSSPFLVLKVSTTIIKVYVAVFSEGSLHHSDAALKEALKLR